MNTTAQLDKVTTLSHQIMEKMTDTTPTSDAMILMIMNGRATRKINQLLDETLSPTAYGRWKATA